MGLSLWHEQHAQEPPTAITPTPTPTGSPTATTQPLTTAERTIYLPLVQR